LVKKNLFCCDADEPKTVFLVKEQAHWLLVLDRLCLLRSRMCLHKRLHNGLLPDLDTVITGGCPHEARLLTCFPVQGYHWMSPGRLAVLSGLLVHVLWCMDRSPGHE